MTPNPATQTFDASFTLPDYATRLDVAFHDGNGNWDNNAGNNWGNDVAGAHGTPPYETPPIAVQGSPLITDSPASGPNHAGDNMDFNLAGTPLRARDPHGGFANFGEIYFNYDTTNLYVGASSARHSTAITS